MAQVRYDLDAPHTADMYCLSLIAASVTSASLPSEVEGEATDRRSRSNSDWTPRSRRGARSCAYGGGVDWMACLQSIENDFRSRL